MYGRKTFEHMNITEQVGRNFKTDKHGASAIDALVSYRPQLLTVSAHSGHGLLNYGVIQSADPLLRSTHPSVYLPATMNDPSREPTDSSDTGWRSRRG
jgi:hypothetical protein